MQRVITLALALIFVLAIGYLAGVYGPRLVSPATAPTEPTREITARDYPVLSIVDGDTFRIMYDGEPTKVRIANIDTPERGHPDYDEATEALRRFIEGRTVTIAFTDPKGKRDNWGRLLCSVSVDGQDVGEAMIAAGLAERWGE